jgi:glutamine amidotransferase
MIAIIDYDAGNLRSVEKAFTYLGYPAVVTKDKDVIKSAKAVVLPGVGAFYDGMRKLKAERLDQCIYDVIDAGKPFLGICLGLQLLFEQSEEDGIHSGLGILQGKVKRIPATGGLKVPQIGWNSLHFCQKDCSAFTGLEDGSFVYFVHSYYLDAAHKEEVSATTMYGVTIDAAVKKGRISAFQFHPEKSGDVGLRILKNLAKEWRI